MGVWNNIKNIFSKKEEPKVVPEGNKHQSTELTEEELDAALAEAWGDIQDTINKTEQENRAFENSRNDMIGRLKSLDNAPGRKHMDAVEAQQANDFIKWGARQNRKEKRKAYLEQNPESRLDTLLAKIKQKELMAKLGLTDKYSGDYEAVLDKYNYEQISIIMKKPEILFIPYLQDLEEQGGFYETDELPESVKEKYEKYKQAPQRELYLAGFALGSVMGIYDLNDFSDYFPEDEKKTIQEVIQGINERGGSRLAKTLPTELQEFVSVSDKDKDNSREL